MAAFTGPTSTSKRVIENAAGTLKRLTLELGGNDAAIVLEDVQPQQVAPEINAAAIAGHPSVPRTHTKLSLPPQIWFTSSWPRRC